MGGWCGRLRTGPEERFGQNDQRDAPPVSPRLLAPTSLADGAGPPGPAGPPPPPPLGVPPTGITAVPALGVGRPKAPLAPLEQAAPQAEMTSGGRSLLPGPGGRGKLRMAQGRWCSRRSRLGASSDSPRGPSSRSVPLHVTRRRIGLPRHAQAPDRDRDLNRDPSIADNRDPRRES